MLVARVLLYKQSDEGEGGKARVICRILSNLAGRLSGWECQKKKKRDLLSRMSVLFCFSRMFKLEALRTGRSDAKSSREGLSGTMIHGRSERLHKEQD